MNVSPICMAVSHLRMCMLPSNQAFSRMSGSGGEKPGWQMVCQNSRSLASRCSGALPAMIAVFSAPMEMPAIQFGAMPAASSPSNTPAWYAPSAPPPCSTSAMFS